MSMEEAALLVAYWDEEERLSHQIVWVDYVVLIQDTQTIRGRITCRDGTTEKVEFPVSSLTSGGNIGHISHPIWRQFSGGS